MTIPTPRLPHGTCSVKTTASFCFSCTPAATTRCSLIPPRLLCNSSRKGTSPMPALRKGRRVVFLLQSLNRRPERLWKARRAIPPDVVCLLSSTSFFNFDSPQLSSRWSWKIRTVVNTTVHCVDLCRGINNWA